MADDTTRQSAADRSQVAAGEGYEVAYFAKKHRMTRAAARELIADRTKDVLAAANRSTGTVRKRVVAAPAAVSRGAGRAIDARIGAAAAGLATGLAVNLGRKAVAQLPSVMAGHWFEALKTEHGLALALFDRIEATADTEQASASSSSRSSNMLWASTPATFGAPRRRGATIEVSVSDRARSRPGNGRWSSPTRAHGDRRQRRAAASQRAC